MPDFPSFPFAAAVVLAVVVSLAAAAVAAAAVYLVAGVHIAGCLGTGSYSFGSHASWPLVHAGPGKHSCRPSYSLPFLDTLHRVPGRLGWVSLEVPGDHRHELGHILLGPYHTHHLPVAVPDPHIFLVVVAAAASLDCKHAVPSSVALAAVCIAAGDTVVVAAAAAACIPGEWAAGGDTAGTSD